MKIKRLLVVMVLATCIFAFNTNVFAMDSLNEDKNYPIEGTRGSGFLLTSVNDTTNFNIVDSIIANQSTKTYNVVCSGIGVITVKLHNTNTGLNYYVSMDSGYHYHELMGISIPIGNYTASVVSNSCGTVFQINCTFYH